MSVGVPAGAVPHVLEAPGTLVREPRIAARRALAPHLALLGLVLCLGTVAVGAANTPSLLPETVRPIQSWLAGPFGGLGPHLGFPLLAGLFTSMFVCYVLAARGAERIGARTLLLAIAALHALVLLAPPLQSTDIFSYQAYGRMGALYGANPYLHGPGAIALDPLYPYIGKDWVATPTVYGPLFTLLSYALAPLSIALATLSYKAIAAVSSLATIVLVWRIARLRGLDPRRATALLGLNPLVILFGVGGGHNDLLMLAPMMAGIYLMLTHRDRGAAASTVLAAGIKISAGLLLPFMLAGARRPAPRDRRRDVLLGAALAGALVLAGGFVIAGTGSLNLLATLFRNQSQGDWHSVSGIISAGLGLHLVGRIVAGLLALGFLALAARLLRGVWRGEIDWIAAAGWTTFALLLCAGSILPWYVAWLMPLAGLSGDRRLWQAAIGVTGVVLALQVLGYVPHGLIVFGPG